MVQSNIAVSHADTGLLTARVVRAEQISENFIRLTVGSDELRDWRHVGFDQWFRLAVPTTPDTRFDNLSDRFGMGGYVRYLTLPRATRPEIRNYTVREFREQDGELDIDFVIHGTHGVAGPWASRLPVGDEVALIDQGAGFTPMSEDVVLVGDETAMPAVLGIVRDLAPTSCGTAIIELSDLRDQQAVSAPTGLEVRFVERGADERPGTAALAELARTETTPQTQAFAAGGSALATGARRFLVNERGLAKTRITFCGYYKLPARH